MIGRVAELARLEAAFTAPTVTAATIVGEAGAGKSHLAREVASRWESGGALVERTVGTRSAASIPFGAMARFLRGGPVPVERLELLQALTTEIARRGGERRVVLLVDDAHLLDAGSAAFVHHLTTTGLAFVLQTVRSGESCEDAILRVAGDPAAVTVELGPLTGAEVEAMIVSLLDGPVDGRSLDLIAERAQGNPLSVRELVVAGMESGALRNSRGVWCLRGELPPNGRAASLMQERMAGLDRPERRALAVLAMAEPLDLAAFEQLVGGETVIALESRRLIRVGEEPGHSEVRFDHPLFGDVMRTQVGPREAGALRRDIGAVLAAAGLQRPGDVLRVARWQLESGEAVDPALMLQASRAAHHVFDRDLARRLAAAALDAGGGLEAAISLGLAQSRLNLFEEADTTLAPFEGEAADSDLTFPYLHERFTALHVGLGRSEQAQELLRRARAWRGDRAWHEQLRAWEAIVLFDLERFPEVVEQGLDLFADGVDQVAMLTAAFPVPLALLMLGRTEQAQGLADSAMNAAFERAGDLRQTTLLALSAGVAIALESAKDWDGQEAFNQLAHDAGVQWRHDELIGMMCVAMGRLALNRGAIATALRKLREAAPRIRVSDPRALLSVTLTMTARALATLGDHQAAVAARAVAEDALRRRTVEWMDRVEVVRADVWIAYAAGELGRAQELAVAGAPLLERTPIHEIQVWHDALRMGVRDAAVFDRMSVLADQVDSPLAQACQCHAAALRLASASALEDAAREFERLGAWLLAAEAAAQASTAGREEGRLDAARRCAVLSRRLAARTDGARSPALLETVADGLTRREREIALLVSRGRSNQEIAERLGVSRRTVESHVYHVFSKLGIERRDELATVFG